MTRNERNVAFVRAALTEIGFLLVATPEKGKEVIVDGNVLGYIALRAHDAIDELEAEVERLEEGVREWRDHTCRASGHRSE